MPEGPEIRRAAEAVAQAIAGQVTTEVMFAFDHLKEYEPMLSGQKVDQVQSRGKAILVRFDNGLTIYSHNQLYGKWFVRSAQNFPKTKRQLRLAIHNRQKSALLYSASDIEVLREEELETHPFLSKLGPDLLDENVTVEQVVDRFIHKEFYRRKLTSLLLDQHFLAGMGNYLRSEVLFVGRVHPWLRPADCSPAQIRQLSEGAVQMSRQSYLTGGITNNLQLVDCLKEEGLARKDYRFWVFDREDKPCFVCGTPIVKDEAGGRRLYFCPNCQVGEA